MRNNNDNNNIESIVSLLNVPTCAECWPTVELQITIKEITWVTIKQITITVFAIYSYSIHNYNQTNIKKR